jgi:hypothetical protein
VYMCALRQRALDLLLGPCGCRYMHSQFRLTVNFDYMFTYTLTWCTWCIGWRIIRNEGIRTAILNLCYSTLIGLVHAVHRMGEPSAMYIIVCELRTRTYAPVFIFWSQRHQISICCCMALSACLRSSVCSGGAFLNGGSCLCLFWTVSSAVHICAPLQRAGECTVI